MTLSVACLDCGRPTTKSPCPTCQRARGAADYYQSRRWKRLRAVVRRRQGGRCAVCDSTHRFTVHHKASRTEGGEDVSENLVGLCGFCHSRYEADLRTGKDTPLVRIIEAL